MLKNVTNVFSKKHKAIKEEIALKSQIDETISEFIKDEMYDKYNFKCQLSHSVNNGVIKIETDNKVVAQEIALRIKTLEERLRRKGVTFRKVLV